MSVWQPSGASSIGAASSPTAPSSSSASAAGSFEARCWDGVWEPVERVGSGVGGASLGMFGVVLLSDARTIIAHGFQGALHVWRRGGDASGAGGGERAGPPSSSALVLREAAEFDLLSGSPTRHARQLAPWRAAPAPGGHFRAVADLSWASRGQYLLSCGADCTTRAWAPVAVAREGALGVTQWHEVGRPQIHGYEVNALCAAGGAHRFASGADEKVLRVFDAPALFLDVLRATSGPALLASGYGAVEDAEAAPGGRGAASSGGGRAAFAYVPELGLTNKAVLATVGSSAAAAATRDRFHLDSRDELQREKGGAAEAEPRAARDADEGAPGSAHVRPEWGTPFARAPPLEEELVTQSRWPEADKLHGHANELQCLAASGLGLLVASACDARSEEAAAVLVWDARSCRLLQRLGGHKLTVQQLAFSPALACVAPLREEAGRAGGVSRGALFALSDAAVPCPDAAGDSEFLVSAGRDRQICVFGAAEGSSESALPPTSQHHHQQQLGPLRLLRVALAHKRQLWAVSFAPVPDSSRLLGGRGRQSLTGLRLFATGARDQTVRFWSLQRRIGGDDDDGSGDAGGDGGLALAECGSLSFEAAVTAVAFAPLCRLGPRGSPAATEASLLLAVGLESGRCCLVRGSARREDGLAAWTWACAVDPTSDLRGHSGAVRRLAWRPLAAEGGGENSGGAHDLELASGGDDSAVVIQRVEKKNL